MSFLCKPLCAWLAVSAGLVCAASPESHVVAARGSTYVADGAMGEWTDVPFVSVTSATGVLDAKTTAPADDQDLAFRFSVGYDDSALYVAVEVTDDAVVADSCELGSVSAPAWDDDAVEIFIDGNHNRALDSRVADNAELRYGGEFSIIANGAAMSDYSGYPKSFGQLWGGATNYTSVTNGAATEMTYEFRIAWAAMGLRMRPEAIGFNLSVQDDDDGGRRDHALYWTGNPQRPFSDESQFGTIFFK